MIPSSFAIYILVFMWLNLIYCFVLGQMIKYDHSKNRNNCVMRNISIVVLILSNTPLLPLLDIFFSSMWLNYMYCCVLSLRIKYKYSKNWNNCVMRTISIVVLIWPKIMWLVSCWFDWKNMWQVSCNLYLNGIDLISWLFMWMMSHKNKYQQCCNVIFRENDSIHGFDMIKKYFKAK